MTQAGKPTLGRLERVDLRQAWLGEATDFTPWLAEPENIALLGETLGIELEVESQEKDVGPFRADILCRDTITNKYVLIENQLERTDHGHLGQLITYAAGLEAVSVVWIAAHFTDEHRAALDWLNAKTDADLNFFGLEIELWRIGTSLMAPKFNVVSMPNDWAKSVKEQASSVPLTEAQDKHLAFWMQYREYLEVKGDKHLPTKLSKGHWTNVPVGRMDFSLVLANNFKEGRSSVQLLMTGPHAKAHYGLIEQRYREAVEAELKPLGQLHWRLLPDAKESHIMVVRDVSPADRASWPALNEWMSETVAVMSDLFRPIVKELDASEWVTVDPLLDAGQPSPTDAIEDGGASDRTIHTRSAAAEPSV